MSEPMIVFDLRKILPRFILDDREGYAMARAMEAGMNDYLSVCQAALENFSQPEKMEEWRLDELAWEYNIPYDYYAEIDIKRKWIADAIMFYRTQGTPGGIIQYLKARFDSATVEDGASYGGDPYHFRVIVSGESNEANNRWAQMAVSRVKNVRSILDNIIYNGDHSDATTYLSAWSGVEVTGNSTAD